MRFLILQGACRWFRIEPYSSKGRATKWEEAMRVLHILNDVTDRGNGIVNTAVDLAIEQARQGVKVAVVSGGGGYQSLLEDAGVLHLTLDQSRDPARIISALRLFWRHILAFQPDVVHAHMRTGLLLAWLCSWFHRFVLIGHVHNVHDRESTLMGLANCVIAVSQSTALSMAKRGIARNKIRVVLNRTLRNSRNPAIEEVAPAKLARPSIVTVCGMSHRKGVAELISAFEIVGGIFRDTHLYLVGDGPQRELFERQALRSRWSSRIHFEGFHSTPQAYMLSADVFVLASRRESFGLVLIEARQAGCAIIASDVDGVAEALDGGLAGMLIPSENVNALATSLCRLLGQREERDMWRARARTNIELYNIKVMASEVQTIYDDLKRESRWHGASRLALPK